jgi:DNA-3-methyladenine glycosylase II
MMRDEGAVSQRHSSDQSPFVIGLTGPIASGKSTVAEMLRQRGAEVIDADRVYRSLLIPGSELWRRVVERFGGTPAPEQILADDPEALRLACGFSRAKVAYLRSLAEHVLSGELELDRLNELPDEHVIRELTAVKGIGVWTAHMFLMFTLHRPDVLPVGDLGVRNAAMRAYGLAAVPAPAALEAMAEPWRPHRTRACLYLWRSLDNEPV